MNTKKRLIKLFLISSVFILVMFNLFIGFKAGNCDISLNHCVAFADGESDPVYCTCYVGQTTTKTIYDECRWCGSCTTKRVIKTGDGTCRCLN